MKRIVKLDLSLFIIASLLTIIGGILLAFKDTIVYCNILAIAISLFVLAGVIGFACIILSICLLVDLI